MSRFVVASAARVLLVFLFVCLGSRSAWADCPSGQTLCNSVIIDAPTGGVKLELTCCGSGEVCIDKKCWPSPPRCLDGTDCAPDGGICGSGGVCACTSDDQCGGDAGRCELESGLCYVTCSTDKDCDEGYTCNDTIAKCMSIDCDNNDDCDAGTCDDRDPGHKVCRVRCLSSEECGKFGTCWPGGRCAPPCDSNLECEGGICLDDERYCAARGEPITDTGFSCATGPIGAGAASFVLVLPLVLVGLRWARRRRVDS